MFVVYDHSVYVKGAILVLAFFLLVTIIVQVQSPAQTPLPQIFLLFMFKN